MTAPTDTSERGLERLICSAMTGSPCDPGGNASTAGLEHITPSGTGWLCGNPNAYDREYCVDLAQLSRFLNETQPGTAESLALDQDGPTRRGFLARLQGEISKRGTIDVLRNGIDHGPRHIDLNYATPTPGNPRAEELHAANRFTVTRQLRYSRDETQRSIDLALFLNGLPVATFELKNSLTNQTVADAVEQYKRDRDPREKLFEFGRCIVHFAVDDSEVRFTTHLKGKTSWFLPFDQGWNDGAGNPPNPEGLKTDYLWKWILAPASLTNILENYAQMVAIKDERTGKKRYTQIWPRYHQLDVARKLLADAYECGPGRRYLVQHSAGSGKSNSIAWLAHQLIGLRRNDRDIFDTVIVVTDRRILDKQIRDTIKQFAQIGATVGHAEGSGDLKRFLQEGKKIVITTLQKFPYVLDDIGNEHRNNTFGIIIDEAHSSQGGRAAAAMSRTLAEGGEAGGDETPEDTINRIMETRKLLPNASYFAFTATPKNKTLEIFGERIVDDVKGRRKPFHGYTMKQAIQEGFILDVLEHYTPVQSFYKLIKTVDADPEFDANKARKKLRKYVESNDHAIRLKAEIMVDHFHEHVIGTNKIGGEARAMIITSGIERAMQYFHQVSDYLRDRKSPYSAIVAFSGEHEYGGVKVTESSLNNFPSNSISERIREDPYRFLIAADKFQTGYDEPLLHTMYVDKPLSGVKAVQTLSRLNRAHPKKHDVFVLDFANDAVTITAAFEPYYRTTLLARETDPNKLHDLKNQLDKHQVYGSEQVDSLVNLFLAGAERDRLDPILDTCVAAYLTNLDEDEQVDFKGNAKAFVRTYGFLALILPYTNADWEKLSTFLNLLVPKLPAPREEDLSRGILETIDMDSYRVEKHATMALSLADADAEIEPVPTASGGHLPEPEMDYLSNILNSFNEMWGNVDWKDADRVRRTIAEDIPRLVSEDTAYQNALKNSDEQNARIEHDKALRRAVVSVMHDVTELFKLYSDNPSFKRWLADSNFRATYQQGR
jgi:type I restriction enzyme R subunit